MKLKIDLCADIEPPVQWIGQAVTTHFRIPKFEWADGEDIFSHEINAERLYSQSFRERYVIAEFDGF